MLRPFVGFYFEMVKKGWRKEFVTTYDCVWVVNIKETGLDFLHAPNLQTS